MQASVTNLVEVISLDETKALLKVGETTIDKYRKEYWLQGVHYFQPEPGAKITYNKPMILVWLISYSVGDTAMHDRALEVFTASIPGNQPKRARG
jgi:hypothetical protein